MVESVGKADETVEAIESSVIEIFDRQRSRLAKTEVVATARKPLIDMKIGGFSFQLIWRSLLSMNYSG